MASAWFRRRQRAEAPDAVDVIGLPYLRVSSGKQERGYSPEAQRREIAAYIRRMGWEPGPEYRDADRGTKISRSDYQRLLTDARRLTAEGRRVAIVSVALDRYGRNLEEQLRSKRELAAQGASLHFTREGGELDDDGTIMRGWMAQKEVQKLGERVTASKRVVADMGLPPSGPAPWGYRWRLPQTAEEERLSVGKAVRRVLAVAENEAPAVRTLFARAASGETLGTLARWVATLDDEERGGRVLKRSAIGRVLRSGV
ncbi:MAG TPA: recombinase family protein, partial [Chloroflexota bacterium]|nr:recombinase family protein [Chloroflexota bacterium]